MLGSPPSVVAEFPVWISLAVPLLLGILLVWLWPLVPAQATGWLSVVGEILRLDWLFRFGWWSIHGLSDILGSALRVIEGAGALGWLLVFLLLGYLLGR